MVDSVGHLDQDQANRISAEATFGGLKAAAASAAAAGLYTGYSAGTEHNPYPSIPGAPPTAPATGAATDNSFYGSLVSSHPFQFKILLRLSYSY